MFSILSCFFHSGSRGRFRGQLLDGPYCADLGSDIRWIRLIIVREDEANSHMLIPAVVSYCSTMCLILLAHELIEYFILYLCAYDHCREVSTDSQRTRGQRERCCLAAVHFECLLSIWR